jgi:hypothetical protein
MEAERDAWRLRCESAERKIPAGERERLLELSAAMYETDVPRLERERNEALQRGADMLTAEIDRSRALARELGAARKSLEAYTEQHWEYVEDSASGWLLGEGSEPWGVAAAALAAVEVE